MPTACRSIASCAILTARPGAAELAACPPSALRRAAGIRALLRRALARDGRGSGRPKPAAGCPSSSAAPAFICARLTPGPVARSRRAGCHRRRGRGAAGRIGAPGLHARAGAPRSGDGRRGWRRATASASYRAWTVHRATGRSLAEWQASPARRRLALPDLRPDAAARAALRRLSMRGSIGMVEQGALEEVRSLLALGLDPSLPAMKAVGVRELGEVIAGRQRPRRRRLLRRSRRPGAMPSGR